MNSSMMISPRWGNFATFTSAGDNRNDGLFGTQVVFRVLIEFIEQNILYDDFDDQLSKTLLFLSPTRNLRALVSE